MENSFELGKIRLSRSVAFRLCQERLDEGKTFADFVIVCMGRHIAGDWGDLPEGDKTLNDEAVANGGRIFSVYNIGSGDEKLWIVTDADRSATTVLFPDEY